MYPHERSLVKRLEGKPFALVGVNSDEDRAKLKEAIKKENITWRSFWDRNTTGPIDRAWNVQSWPTIYVLDHQGVIRYKQVHGKELDQAIDTLVKEAQGGADGRPAKKEAQRR
jgi:hypothetical protein